MLPKIVLISILSVILFTFNINCEDNNDFCNLNKEYWASDVRFAFTIEDYIVLFIQLFPKHGFPKQRLFRAIRVYHTIKKNLTDPHNGLFYDAKRWEYIENLIEESNWGLSHGFFFTTSKNTALFPDVLVKKGNWYQKKQVTTVVYFLRLIEEKRHYEGSHVKAMAFDTEYLAEKVGNDPSFEKLGEKKVFNFSEPEFDDTGVTNLKLLFAHFPNDVYIKGLVIVERQLDKNNVMYYSFVYTQERMPDGRFFRVRHYLKGIVNEYQASLERKFSRIIWEFDYNFSDKEGDNNVCTEIPEVITAVTVAHTEHLNGSGTIYHLIEFYGTEHRYLLMSVAENGTLSLSGNDALMGNEVFFNCAIRPLPVVVVSDCRKNPLFESQKYETLDEVDKKSKQHIESENWRQIWIVLTIIAMIIAIIALISYGVYSVVSVNKQNSNQ